MSPPAPTRYLGVAVATALCAAVLVPLLPSEPASAGQRWLPKPTTAAWQWQLQGKIDTSINARVYEVDGFETPAKTVAKLHRQGRRAICYLDVGSWESYRPSTGLGFSAIGKGYDLFARPWRPCETGMDRGSA